GRSGSRAGLRGGSLHFTAAARSCPRRAVRQAGQACGGGLRWQGGETWRDGMTEQEWVEGTDSWPMFDSLCYLRGQVSNRTVRLLAVACCRRIWDQLTDERSRGAVELAESYADGLADRKALVTAWRAASGPARIRRRYSGYGTPQAIARDTALLGVTEAVGTVL